MLILKAGLLYFLLVFATGFVLGALRTIFLVPRLGDRTSELLETPLMLTAIWFSANWIVEYLPVPYAVDTRLGMGILALLCMISAECGLVLKLRRMTISEYFRTRDPLSGTVYYICLAIFALLPLFIG